MTPEKRQKIIFYGRALMYIFFALAYVSAVALFALLFENYWAAGGFALTIVLILVRLWQFLMPTEKLYVMFPVASWQRALWQSSFFALFLGAFGVALWLFARGLQKRQNWKGDSYFCSMTGVFMASKWSFFLTLPIKNLRPDTIDEPTMAKIRSTMGISSDSSSCSEPFGYSGLSKAGTRKSQEVFATV